MAAGIRLKGSNKGAARVGRTLNARTVPIEHKRGSMRWRFIRNFRKLTQHRDGSDMSPTDIARLLGCSEDMARKYLRGDKMPDMESWEGIAKKLGLGHWSDLFASS